MWARRQPSPHPYRPAGREAHRAVARALLQNDHYMLLADFRAYLEAQEAVDRAFREPAGWDREAILNVAGMGLLSAERTVRDYASGIWDLKPSAPPAVAERAA